MTLVLDSLRREDGWQIAVACEVRVRTHLLNNGVVGRATKTPVAVVMFDGASLTAMDMKGRQLDVATLGKECPGLLDVFGVADLPV